MGRCLPFSLEELSLLIWTVSKHALYFGGKQSPSSKAISRPTLGSRDYFYLPFYLLQRLFLSSQAAHCTNVLENEIWMKGRAYRSFKRAMEYFLPVAFQKYCLESMCGIALAMGHMPAAWDRGVWLSRSRFILMLSLHRLEYFLISFPENPSCTIYCEEMLHIYVWIFIITRLYIKFSIDV